MHAEGGEEPAIFGVEHAVGAVQRHNFAADPIAIRVGGEAIAQRGPGPEIAPLEPGLQHRHAVGLFHDTMVDGDGGGRLEVASPGRSFLPRVEVGA